MYRVFEEHGAEKQLVMAGNQSGKNLSNAYNAMDLFIFASKTETHAAVRSLQMD
jgi:1,2-diacylglycerol 3-alpha-glucosyltransferase